MNAKEAMMSDDLPRGLQATMDNFVDTVKNLKGLTKDEETKVRDEMKERLEADYKNNEDIWPKVGNTVLGFVRMGARLAVASVGHEKEFKWNDAKKALKAVQEECNTICEGESQTGIKGRHCRTANFDR